MRKLINQMEDDRLSASTRKGTLAVISGAFEYGREARGREIKLNPARGLPGKRPQPKQMEPIDLDGEAVRALVMATHGRHRPVVGLCAYSGLRIRRRSDSSGATWRSRTATSHLDQRLGPAWSESGAREGEDAASEPDGAAR